MSGRKLLIWVIFALVAAAAFFLSDYDAEQKQARQNEANRVVSLSDPLTVQTVELSGAEVPKPVRIVRDEKARGWRLTEPVQCPADSLTVGRLIGDVLDARVSERLKEPGELGQFGLKPPDFSLTLTDGKGQKAVLLLGDLSPTKDHVYGSRPDATEVWFLPPTLRSAVDRPLFDLRDKAMVDFVVMNVESLSLTQGGQELAVRRERTQGKPDAPASWSFADGQPADPEQVEDLLFQIHGLRAKSFLDTGIDPVKMGLDKPVLSLAIGLTGDRRTGLVVGGPVLGEKERYARRTEGGPVMTLDQAGLERLKKADRAMLTPRWVRRFDRLGARTLEVVRDGGALKYAMQDGQWRRVSPADGPRTEEAAALVIWDLANLKWERMLPEGGAYGLDKPQAVIRVGLTKAGAGDTKGMEEYTLTLGTLDPASGLLAARVEGDPRIYGVSPKLMQGLPKETAKKDRQS